MSDEEIFNEFDVGCPVCDLRGAIRAAIAVEREACAKIAKDLGASIMCIEDDDDDSPTAVGAAIATAIRARGAAGTD